MKATFIQPHDDDAVISIGGTLLKLLEKGWDVSYIIMTDGRHGGNLEPDTIKDMRAKEAKNEREFLNILEFHNYNIEDGKMKDLAEHKIKTITEDIAEKIKDSDVVFIPGKAEGHPDHRKTYEIGHNAIKLAQTPIEAHYIVWLFPLYYHNPGELENILKVNIDSQMNKKLQAIRLHNSQVEWGRYDRMAQHVNSYFSLIYSTYRHMDAKYSEIIGIQKKNSKYQAFLDSLEDAEDVTEIFHGRKDEKIKA